MTFLLLFVIYQTAVDKKSLANGGDNPIMAPIAIGFAVFLAHVVLLPITGCSINPPRSFGPAIIATIYGEDDLFEDFWIFVVAPFSASVACALYVLQERMHATPPLEEKKIE
eukprot:UN16765